MKKLTLFTIVTPSDHAKSYDTRDNLAYILETATMRKVSERPKITFYTRQNKLYMT